MTEAPFNISFPVAVYAIVGSSLVNTTGSNYNKAVKFHSATKDKFIIASETQTATWIAVGK